MKRNLLKHFFDSHTDNFIQIIQGHPVNSINVIVRYILKYNLFLGTEEHSVFLFSISFRKTVCLKDNLERERGKKSMKKIIFNLYFKFSESSNKKYGFFGLSSY